MATELGDRLATGLKASLVSGLVRSATNAALIVLLTRYLLDPADYGRLFLALSVVGIVGFLGTLGLPKSTARYVTEYAETAPDQIRPLLARGTLVLVGLSVTVGLVLAAVGGRLAALLGEPTLAPLLVVGGGYVVARSATSYLTVVFQGFNRVAWSALVTVVSNVGRLAFVVGFVLLGWGAFGAFLGYVAGFAVAALVGGYVLVTRFYGAFPATEDVAPGLLRRLVEYSVPLTATRAANVLDKRVDTVLVGAIISPVAVGYYTVAKQVAEFTAVPVSAFGFTVSPALGEQAAAGNVERAGRLYAESLRGVLTFYVPAATGLFLVAGPLVRHVFGTAYLAAVPVLQVFAGFVVVNAVNKVTNDGLDYLGRARSRAVAQGVMAVTNVGLNLLLLPVLGVTGAAVATVITYTVYTLANVYFITQELSPPLPGMAGDGATICVVAAGMAVPVLWLRPHVGGIPSLLAVVAAGGLIWAALSVFAGLVDVERIAGVLG
jgi:O-antigen/teichoic acid export membrane protein